MRLTRRDLVAALAAAGVAVGAGAAVRRSDPSDGGDGPIDDDDLATLVAAADVLYPSAVDDVEGFVVEYVRRRAEDRPDHGRAVAAAATYLDDHADAWHGEPFASLDPSERVRMLDRMGADVADPVPDGTDVERVRYYVVNELLFALYSTPTGGELVGMENPRGYPGGLASYQRGSQS
ncbi:MAG: gluconate 2-dehydrogenase subunit 3 family protein [Halobacteriales archaeon]